MRSSKRNTQSGGASSNNQAQRKLEENVTRINALGELHDPKFPSLSLLGSLMTLYLFYGG